MTPSEKRYFKRLGLSNQKDANQYILLFDAINNQEEYDEASLLVQFKNHAFINNFSEIKKYLYQQLQKALRLYHAPKAIDIILYNHLSDIAILYQKELYVDCEQLIRKTKKLATKHEKFNILLLLNEWKRNVVRISHHSSGIYEYLNEEVPLDKEYILNVKNESDYFNTGLEMLLIAREKGMVTQNNLKLNTPSLPPLTFRSKRYLLWKHSQLSALEEDYLQSFNANREEIELFEQNKHFIDAMPKQYVVALSNAMASCEASNHHHHFKMYLDKLLEVLDKYPFNPEFELKEKLLAYIMQTAIHNQKAQKSEILEANKTLKHSFLLMEKKGYTDTSLALYVYYELLHSAIIIDNFELALEYYNDIQQLDIKDNRAILHLSNRLIGIMLHYHFENWLFLESLVRSTARIVKLKFSHDTIAEVFIKTIKKCIAIRVSPNTPDEETIGVLQQLQHELQNIPVRMLSERYVLLAWIDSLISGKNIADCVPQIIKQYRIS